MLQLGGPENEPERHAWRRARAISLRYCDALYRRLGVVLTEADVCGESFYERDDRLPKVVAELRATLPPRDRSAAAAGAYAEMRDDAGAACIFLYDAAHRPRFRNPAGDELPMIVQKSDGAYLYATTDLAAVRFRIRELGARRLIYVTGAPQKLHFAMFFAAAEAAGWLAGGVRLEHVTFGSVLGDNRKPLKTRSGENVRLNDLLDEAETRAAALLAEKLAAEPPEYRATFTPEEQRAVAQRIGIGSVKYFDLARDRNGDYIFNWDQMLSMQGNTAPYMLYAYARIRSIYRRAAAAFGQPEVYAPGVRPALRHPAERALGLRLVQFREALDAVAAELLPHILCNYVYDLATEFMRFYEACPVVQAADEATRLARMRLCDLTARTLRLGLGLLGIDVTERM
jgi:arginyl-tRNA synthetase